MARPDPIMIIWRLSALCVRLRLPILPSLLYAINRVLFGIVLPPQATIERNVKFAYLGLGTVVHKDSIIKSGTIVATGVTIGGRAGRAGVPTIEQNVYIGTGAKILGPITIGAGATVGANAVVLTDVPPNMIAVGVPAKIKTQRPKDE